MLTSLSIRDLALVEALELELAAGFTVLTGETGAGKSILLTALGLALGDRADSGLVRPGAGRAEVTLQFDLSDLVTARAWLDEHELADDPDVCFIRRTVGSDGRSKAYVNGRPVTLQQLQEFSSLLVEIHGQHAHLALLQAREQRRLLDESSGTLALVGEVGELYGHWRTLQDQLTQRRQTSAQRAAREELLRYQVEELERHEVCSIDYEQVLAEHSRLANVGRILALSQQQLDLLYDDEAGSANRLLAQAVTSMKELGALCPELAEVTAMLLEAQIQIKEAAASIRHHVDRLESDPKRLEWLEERIGDLNRLARKHQVTPAELGAQLATLSAELESLGRSEEQVAELERAVHETLERYQVAARRLSEQRSVGAAQLSTRITAVIRELGMPYGEFQISVQPSDETEAAPHGLDRIEFSVTANPGLPARPIGKVASGGELSRISLAIQVSAIAYKSTPTLIFDEVDTGIGGGVAEIVGQKLRLLAADRQVLCVTHLPQVAAQGHNHLLVAKSTQNDVTQTMVSPISPTERTREIARMLGGVRITEQTLAHAEEMLAQALS